MLLNELSFAGNAGADARDATTPSGTRVVTFSLCHNERGKDGAQDRQTWVRVKVFGGWCDLAASVRKGDNIFVKGRLDVNAYTDKDGNARTSVDVVAFVLGRIAREEQRAQSSPPQGQRPAATEQRTTHRAAPPPGQMDESDIPF